MSALEDHLAAAKLWLISPRPAPPTPTVPARRHNPRSREVVPADLPYLAHALYALRPVPTPDVPTMTADERWRVYVNPDWTVRTSTPEVGRELAHLVWHLLMDHADRARDMHVEGSTARAWQQACDLAVHDTLAPGGACPADLVRDAVALRREHPAAAPGRSAEEYYAVLSGLPAVAPAGPAAEDAEGHCGSACDGLPRPTDLPADADIGQVDEVEGDILRHLVAREYLEADKSLGTGTGDALRWANHLVNPVIPWQPLLGRAVRFAVGWASGREQPTWTRPSRRQSSTPAFLQPGWRRPVPSIAMVVDTSASVDDRLLGQAIAEVEAALTALGVPGASVTVYACDAAVRAVTRVRKPTQAMLVGGGGTDMRVGIKAASQARPRPDLIVVFTDGYTPWPTTPPPGSAVVAAMLRRPGVPVPPTPSWATRVDCVAEG